MKPTDSARLVLAEDADGVYAIEWTKPATTDLTEGQSAPSDRGHEWMPPYPAAILNPGSRLVLRPDHLKELFDGADNPVFQPALLHCLPRNHFISPKTWEFRTSRELHDVMDLSASANDPTLSRTRKLSKRQLLAISMKLAIATVNARVRRGLAEAAPGHALSIARRYSCYVRYRAFAYSAAFGPRVSQALDSFPMLIRGLGNDEVLEIILSGRKLKYAAEVAGLDWAYRKVPPQLVGRFPLMSPQLIHNYWPKTLPRMRQWLITCDRWESEKAPPDIAMWLAKHALELTMDESDILLDWVRACHEPHPWRVESPRARNIQNPPSPDLGQGFVTRQFSPQMRLSTALRLSQEWHAALHDHLNATGPPFPAPWFPSWTKDGFKIIPLDSPQGLYRESRAMRNCAYTLADSVREGSSYFYLVTRDGKHEAMAEIGRFRTFHLAEIRGPLNATVPTEIRLVVEECLARQDDQLARQREA